jgi:biotin carboxyl carrier protein
MAYIVNIDDQEFKVNVERVGRDFVTLLNGKKHNVEVVSMDDNQMALIIDNRPYIVTMDSEKLILVGGETYQVSVIDENVQKLMKMGPAKLQKEELVLKAVMPGLVIDVNVKEGDEVRSGDALLVVEAMKMQNEVKTPQDGVVKKLLIQKGKAVNSGDTLVIIE